MNTRFAGIALLILSFAVPSVLIAQQQGEGETVFKGKCAMCHGQNAEGKVGPKLRGTTVSEDDIVLMLSKGKEGKKAPHSKPFNGLNDEQIKAVAHYVKSLK